MDRRGLLKSLLAAPAAAIVFNKTSEAEEKIKYVDDSPEFYELTTKWTNNQCSGTFNTGELNSCACSGIYKYVTSTGMW